MTPSIETLVGIQPSPTTRGTVDILMSCGLTIFLCVWSIRHLRTQGRNESDSHYLWSYKIPNALFVLFLPEFNAAFSIQQYLAVSYEVVAMRHKGLSWWSREHSFALAARALEIQWSSGKDWIDGPTLLNLLERERLKPEDLPQEEIESRWKVDKTAKILNIVQLTRFSAQCLLRWLTGLPLSLIELTTMSFVTYAVVITWIWRHTPVQITSPCTVKLKHLEDWQVYECFDIARLRADEDFVFATWWKNYLSQNTLQRRIECEREWRLERSMHSKQYGWGVERNLWIIFGILLHVLFTAWHYLPWNYAFPTAVEQIWWRVGTLVLIIFYWIFQGYLNLICLVFYSIPGIVENSTLPGFEAIDIILAVYVSIASTLGGFNMPMEHDNRLENTYPSDTNERRYNMAFKYGVAILGMVYLVFRTFVVVESVVSFRSAPAAIYHVPKWSQLW